MGNANGTALLRGSRVDVLQPCKRDLFFREDEDDKKSDVESDEEESEEESEEQKTRSELSREYLKNAERVHLMGLARKYPDGYTWGTCSNQVFSDMNRMSSENNKMLSKKNKKIKKIFSLQKLSKHLHSSCFRKKKIQKERDDKGTVCVWAPPQGRNYMVDIEGSSSGGYGAIVRNNVGRPTAAAAAVSEPVSLLYHQLQGVKRGLILAKECGCRRVVLCTSSFHVYMVVNQIPYGEDRTPMVKDILEDIEKLASEFKFFLTRHVPKQVNRAADYLSKMYKNIDFKRSELPKELADIVWDDASGKLYTIAPSI